jgi:hypothetical protein
MKKHEQQLIAARINSSLNRSLSKASYSFSKAARFQNPKKDMLYAFYNMPETKSMRACSMGYGEKSDFTRSHKNISPSLYSFPSSFDPKCHNSPQYTFGVSRDNKNISKRKRNISPGPIYNLSQAIGSGAPSYSLGMKLSQKNVSRSFVSPGPGAYYNENNYQVGKYFDSKFKNSIKVSIGSKAKRFNYKIKQPMPGPSDYSLPPLITKSGCVYESRYRSVPARSFIGHRNTNSKVIISPGPGQYDTFSEFEGYETKIHK